MLEFPGVERLASWVAFVVDEARRHVPPATAERSKICGLPPHLARMFPIAGVGLRVSLHDDEAAAIEAPGPPASGPRPLPIEILSALTRAADILPMRGAVAPVRASADLDGSRSGRSTMSFLGRRQRPARRLASEHEVWLRVQVGAAKGRTIAIYGPKFVIGRDRSCHLRLGSAMVSKLHAAIELRDGRVFVRDLGSTNGTIVDGRTAADSRSRNQGRRPHPDRPGRLHPCRPAATRPASGTVEKIDRRLAARRRQPSPSPYHGESQQTDLVPDHRRPAIDTSPKSASSTKSSRTSLVITPSGQRAR